MSKIDYKKIKKLSEEINKETDAEKELQLSIEKARAYGIPENKILHNIDEIDEYFKS